MTDFARLVIVFFAAVNPAAAAAALARRSEGEETGPGPAGPALATMIAGGLYAAAALGALRLLHLLEVEPETFRIGAGVVMAAVGVSTVWSGRPGYIEAAGGPSPLFPLALPLLAGPAGLVAAISYSADEGAGRVLGAVAVALVAGFVLLAGRPDRGRAGLDAIARLTGALLVVVAVGLIVSGVRDI